MIIDGKAIANDITAALQAEVAALPKPPTLCVFTCAPNFETQKFLTLKQKRAAAIGVAMEVIEIPRDTKAATVIALVKEKASRADGVLLQLPFPPEFDQTALIEAVPKDKDVDALAYDGTSTLVLPPVVGAIAEISRRHSVQWSGKHVAIIGQGKLVGRPAAFYAKRVGANVTILTKDSGDITPVTTSADIIILGAGSPGLLTPEMITPGVVVFDAGTSEIAGVLAGDADPRVAEKASLFTPVPGGIGPITVSILFQNLLTFLKTT